MRTLISGNDAMAFSVLFKGCRFAAGYPITPANETLHTLRRFAKQFGACVKQLDFELYSANACKGWAAAAKHLGMSNAPAGVPFSPTSGPGYLYYHDTIVKMATIRLPAVFSNSMRGGPGLGNIFWSQCDYKMVVDGGGNGDYQTIVIAPSTISETFDYTQRAFDLAIKYQTPVTILTDGRLGQAKQFVELPDLPAEPPKWPSEYFEMRQNAIYKQSIFVDFDLDAIGLREMNNKMQENYRAIEQAEVRYETINIENADILIVAFGSMATFVKDIIDTAAKEHINVGLIRPITLWPFPEKAIREAARQTLKVIVAEMNCGQMIRDVRLAVGQDIPVRHFGEPGGTNPRVSDLLAEIRSFVTGGR